MNTNQDKAKKPRGHWPKGRARSEVSVFQIASILDRLRVVLRYHEPRVRSIRQAARICGVDDRQVRRWIGGRRNPMHRRCVEKLDKWITEQEQSLALPQHPPLRSQSS